MKKISIFIIALLSVFAVIAQDNVIDEIIWVVGDEPIFRSEVENRRLQAQYEGQKIDGDPYCVIPEELAVQKLFLNQAELDSIDVKESEVLPQVDKNISKIINQLGSKEKMEEYFGMSMSRIRSMQMESAVNSQKIQMVQSSIMENVSVTPYDVREFYKNLKKDSIPTIPSELAVEIISIKPKIADAELSEIKSRLRGFAERVKNGDSFATLARMYSDDRISAKVGGELGFNGRGMLVPEFANVAFSLNKPGQVSKVVRTEYGFHIIQLIEKRGDRVNCRHILLKPHVSKEEENKVKLKLDSIASDIRKQKFKFEAAAEYYSDDESTKKNGGLMVNDVTGSSNFKLSELPPAVAEVADKLKIGEISDPFTFVNNKEQELCAIIKVVSKTDAHKASITEDFQLVKNMLLHKKKSDILKNWILEKQKNTYVRISKDWQKCDFKYPGWIKK